MRPIGENKSARRFHPPDLQSWPGTELSIRRGKLIHERAKIYRPRGNGTRGDDTRRYGETEREAVSLKQPGEGALHFDEGDCCSIGAFRSSRRRRWIEMLSFKTRERCRPLDLRECGDQRVRPARILLLNLFIPFEILG